MKKSISGNVVNFTFDDGLAPLSFDCTKMSDANKAYAVPFGMCHRLGDMAALSRTVKGADGKVTVRTITEAMRRDEILAGITHYEAGTEAWDLGKSARVAPQNPVFLAIAAKHGITYDEAMAKVAAEMLGDMGAAE